MIRESIVRDHFASRYVRARVEVRTTFGRIDVMTDEFVVEVEPFATWRHGVRQALAYAQETGKRPAVAVYGDIDSHSGARMWRDCAGLVTIFMLDHRTWTRVRSIKQAMQPKAAPPCDLEPSGPRPPNRRLTRRGYEPSQEDFLRAAQALRELFAGVKDGSAA
jgi:hypothetical protein